MKNAEMKGSAVRHTANHVSFGLYLMIRRIRNASQISDRTGIPRDQNEINKNESPPPQTTKRGFRQYEK